MTRSIKLDTPAAGVAASVAGEPDKPALVLLHGWPQSRALYDSVLEALSSDFFVLAMDLPGIGESRGAPPTGEKTVLADIVLTAAENAGAHDIIVAGLDVGGMIAFAAARDHGPHVAGAVVMNTVIPGVEPWSKVIADPRIWHFAFHAVPELPELLVRGHEPAYFDFFHNFLAADPRRIPEAKRAAFAHAYAHPEALKTGFDWYRAMAKDAEHNAEPADISTPLLYARGDADGRSIEPYIQGLNAAGATNIDSHVIVDSGELLPLEAPEAFIEMLKEYGRRMTWRAEPGRSTAYL
jgi:pimeloyl-ACP methyl ester carboxylesterase